MLGALTRYMKTKTPKKYYVLFRKTTTIFLVISLLSSSGAGYAGQNPPSSAMRTDPPRTLADASSSLRALTPMRQHRKATLKETSSLRAPEGGAAISIPSEFGKIEESFEGSSGKTIIYIKDAHDSLEAQENIAKTIHSLVDKHGIKTVYEEGYEGPVPTDKYFGLIKDPKIREKVAYFLMDKLRVGGAEYAHINRQKDFKLIGADSKKLHLANVNQYRQSAQHKEETARDLVSLETEIRKLADQCFTKDLKEWMRLRERLDKNELSLFDYLKRLNSLPRRSSIKTFEDDKKLVSFPNVFVGNPKTYPAISLLLSSEKSSVPDLLEKVKTIESKTLFQEINQLENDYADSQIKEEKDHKVFEYYKNLQILKRLNAMELSASEFEALQAVLHHMNTDEFARFIAHAAHKPVLLSKRWERNIREAVKFYDLAHQRNQVIEARLADFLANPKEQTAVLVFGGFHREAIKQILMKKQLSYRIVTPKIQQIDERHRAYYKQLMSVGHYDFEVPVNVRIGSRPIAEFDLWDSKPASAMSELRVMERVAQGEFPDFMSMGRAMEKQLTMLHVVPRSEVRTDKPGNSGEGAVAIDDLRSWLKIKILPRIQALLSQTQLEDHILFWQELLNDIVSLRWSDKNTLELELNKNRNQKYPGAQRFSPFLDEFIKQIPGVQSVRVQAEGQIRVTLQTNPSEKEKAVIYDAILQSIAYIYLPSFLTVQTPDFLTLTQWIGEHKYQIPIAVEDLRHEIKEISAHLKQRVNLEGEFLIEIMRIIFDKLKIDPKNSLSVEIGSKSGHIPPPHGFLTVDPMNLGGLFLGDDATVKAGKHLFGDGIMFLEDPQNVQRFDAVFFKRSLWYILQPASQRDVDSHLRYYGLTNHPWFKPREASYQDLAARTFAAAYKDLKPGGGIILITDITDDIEAALRFAAASHARVRIFQLYPQNMWGSDERSDGRVSNEGVIVIEKNAEPNSFENVPSTDPGKDIEKVEKVP